MKLKLRSISISYKSVLLIAGLSIFLLLFFIGLAFVTSRPGFCNSCHIIRPRAIALNSSPHKGIGCLACHQEPGVIGYVKFTLKGMSNLKSVFNTPKIMRANVSDKSCNRCHSDISEIVITKDEISINHQHFIASGFKCTDCHNTVAHGNLTAKSNYATIDKCIICHNNETTGQYSRLFLADKEKVTLWSITHGDNILETHGVGGIENCQGCHSENFCKKCHKVDIPHSENFTYEHGKLAKQEGESCFVCHEEQSSCNNCHKVKMPHSGNWLPEHRSAAIKLGEKICNNCHANRDCTNCHERHIHPGQGRGGKPAS